MTYETGHRQPLPHSPLKKVHAQSRRIFLAMETILFAISFLWLISGNPEYLPFLALCSFASLGGMVRVRANQAWHLRGWTDRWLIYFKWTLLVFVVAAAAASPILLLLMLVGPSFLKGLSTSLIVVGPMAVVSGALIV